MSAYERWGLDFLLHLDGEYRFVLLDERDRRCILCVDRVASRPVCYWHADSRLAFASTPSQLLTVPDIPRRLNRAKLANTLFPYAREQRSSETLHEGVHSIPGGSCLVFERGQLRIHKYWELAVQPNLVPGSQAGVAEGLRELLFACVRDRIGDGYSPASLLSGGLDSSSITAVAARLLEGSQNTLLALSSVLPGNNQIPLRDEREYIDEFQSVKGVRIEYVTAPGRGPFDYLDQPEKFESTFAINTRNYLYDAFEEAALLDGRSLILEGIWGEFGPSTDGSGYRLELFANLRWWELVQTLRNPPRAPSIPALKPAIRSLLSEAKQLVFPTQGFLEYTFLNQQLKDEASRDYTPRKHWPDHQQEQIDLFNRYQLRHASRCGLESLRKIPMVAPFLDRRLLEYCVAAPASMKLQGGYRRCLIRSALEGILPRRIQWRTTKMPFSPDYNVRYNRQLPRVREFVSAIRRTDPVREIVDVDRLSASLGDVQPESNTADALLIVPWTVYLICFLRQFAEYR